MAKTVSSPKASPCGFRAKRQQRLPCGLKSVCILPAHGDGTAHLRLKAHRRYRCIKCSCNHHYCVAKMNLSGLIPRLRSGWFEGMVSAVEPSPEFLYNRMLSSPVYPTGYPAGYPEG